MINHQKSSIVTQHRCENKQSSFGYLKSFARYACDPLVAPPPEADDEDDDEPAGEGGPTFKIPRTMYFGSSSRSFVLLYDLISRSELFESRSLKDGSGVNSRDIRVVGRRIEDESFSISFICLFSSSTHSLTHTALTMPVLAKKSKMKKRLKFSKLNFPR